MFYVIYIKNVYITIFLLMKNLFIRHVYQYLLRTFIFLFYTDIWLIHVHVSLFLIKLTLSFRMQLLCCQSRLRMQYRSCHTYESIATSTKHVQNNFWLSNFKQIYVTMENRYTSFICKFKRMHCCSKNFVEFCFWNLKLLKWWK